MASFNQVILMGNLTRDPQVKYLPSNVAIAEFGIASTHKYKTQAGEQKEDTVFVDCTAWGKTGELIAQYFTKGKPIFICGRLKYDSWEDKQGGGKRSKLTVTVENFQFVGGRDDGGLKPDSGDQRQEQRPASRPAQQRGPAPRTGGGGRPAQKPQEPPFGEEKQFEEADIPFAWEGRSGQIV